MTKLTVKQMALLVGSTSPVGAREIDYSPVTVRTLIERKFIRRERERVAGVMVHVGPARVWLYATEAGKAYLAAGESARTAQKPALKAREAKRLLAEGRELVRLAYWRYDDDKRAAVDKWLSEVTTI